MPIPVTIIILASRTGCERPFSPFAPYRGATLLRRAAEAALRSRAERVVVVLDPDAGPEERKELEGLPLAIVEASAETPLQTGLRAVPAEHRGALLVEGDQPYVSGALLDALLLLLDEGERTRIAASFCSGRRRLPAVIPRFFFGELSASGTLEDAERLLAARDDTAAIPFPHGEHRILPGEEHPELGRISTIIFDFGMVISSFEVARFLRNLVPYTGKSMTELKDILGIVRDIVIEYETGLMTTDDFVSRVFHATNLPLTREQFRQAYNDIFTPITSTHDLIRRLKPHYRLGLLSNTSEWHFQHAIRTAPVFPLFDAVTLSFEVKALKPSRNIYDDMLRKLRAHPHECVYIDDIAENTEAAAWLGMHAIQYRGHDELISELRRTGIII